MKNMLQASNADEIVSRVSAVLVDMTGDWDLDFDGEINRDTRLIGDLAGQHLRRFASASGRSLGQRLRTSRSL